MISFRGMLKASETPGKALYAALEQIRENADNTWLSQLGAGHHRTYTGVPHVNNVENNLDKAVPDRLKERFSPTEVFLLLASVLLHDIGKVNSRDPQMRDHGFWSCLQISMNWPALRIPDAECARWLAILACSHTWRSPGPQDQCLGVQIAQERGLGLPDLPCECRAHELDVRYEATDGPVRLGWLAAMLRLADEVDNQVSRIVPDCYATGPALSDEPVGWRRHISAVVFDPVGGCVRLVTRGLSDWDKSQVAGARNALSAIDDVLGQWSRPLGEIGLCYSKAFLDVSLPSPALLGAEELAAYPTGAGKKASVRVPVAIEPSLDVGILSNVADAMIRLHRSIISPSGLFSWGSLAEEAGIADLDLVRLAVGRLKAAAAGGKHWATDVAPSSDFLGLTVNEEGWRLEDRGVRKPSRAYADLPKPPLIDTGIEGLDELLGPDEKAEYMGRSVAGGFLAPATPTTKRWLSPVIAVEGSSGQGKTTLALQIACNLAKRATEPGEPWACLYYSLEQPAECVRQQLVGHDCFMPKRECPSFVRRVCVLDDRELGWMGLEAKDVQGHLILPRLAPRQTGKLELDSATLFERRFAQLSEALAWIKRLGVLCFTFVDSLTAFSTGPLGRAAIHRLFSLFRREQIPLLVTLERQRHWAVGTEQVHFDTARYLADVVVALDSSDDHGYYRQTVEVAKTRYNRRILGKHLLKLKSPQQSATQGFDNRTGIVVYPSLDYHLVRSRRQSGRREELPLNDPLSLLPIGAEPQGKTIANDTCVVVSGLPGTHKFAVALNLLLRTRQPKPGKLVLSFAEERELKLGHTALLTGFGRWRRVFKPREDELGRAEGLKVWEQEFGGRRGQPPYVRLLNLRMGKILPEEFFYLFEEYLRTREDIDSVLVSDTAQIRTRYPFLSAEGLFLPALIEVLKSLRKFSVFIDVPVDGNADPALCAAADCRMFIERRGDSESVSLRTDNVRGKDYDRRPRLAHVDRRNVLRIKIKDDSVPEA